MTRDEARRAVRAAGLVLRDRDSAGEYRVNFKGGDEGTAYYTSDLADAVATAQAMAVAKGGRQ